MWAHLPALSRSLSIQRPPSHLPASNNLHNNHAIPTLPHGSSHAFHQCRGTPIRSTLIQAHGQRPKYVTIPSFVPTKLGSQYEFAVQIGMALVYVSTSRGFSELDPTNLDLLHAVLYYQLLFAGREIFTNPQNQKVHAARSSSLIILGIQALRRRAIVASGNRRVA